MQAYGEFDNKEYHFEDRTVESKILNNESFGFTRVTIERPERNKNGDIVYKKNRNMRADTSLRDTEDIPLTEDINEYFKREILKFIPDAWIDRKKIKLDMKFHLLNCFTNIYHQNLLKLFQNVLNNSKSLLLKTSKYYLERK